LSSGVIEGSEPISAKKGGLAALLPRKFDHKKTD
jgi:hypothetical protein